MRFLGSAAIHYIETIYKAAQQPPSTSARSAFGCFIHSRAAHDAKAVVTRASSGSIAM